MNKPRMHLREGAHQSVVRSAAIWTPIFITSTALSVAFALIALDSPGAWVSFAIAALVALLSGVSALGALRDIYAEPILTTGVIQRKWRKSDAFIFRGHYILCQKRVFRIPRKIYDELPEVGASVLLEHYPHTSALTAWAKASTEQTEPAGDEDAHVELERATDGPTERLTKSQPLITESDNRGTAPDADPQLAVPAPMAPRDHVAPPRFNVHDAAAPSR